MEMAGRKNGKQIYWPDTVILHLQLLRAVVYGPLSPDSLFLLQPLILSIFIISYIMYFHIYKLYEIRILVCLIFSRYLRKED